MRETWVLENHSTYIGMYISASTQLLVCSPVRRGCQIAQYASLEACGVPSKEGKGYVLACPFFLTVGCWVGFLY